MKRKRNSAHGRGSKSKSSREIRGVFSLTAEGYGFVKNSAGRSGDVFIPPGKTHGAFTGDIVTAAINPGVKKGKGPSGRIIKIEEKSTLEFTATLRKDRGGLVAALDSKDIGSVVVLRNPGSNVADHRVLVEVDRDTIFSEVIYGRVVEDFGHENDPAVDIPCVIRSNGYITEFTPEVRAEAQAAADRDIEIGDRTDCRDPKTAKDFDDAISMRKMRSGWEIWVHIADVAFYVPGADAVDQEALKRSNSVYLLTAVIPMLPEVLSNGACSLNPDVDRAAKTVRIKIDKFGEIKEYEILRTVIRSDRRFDYEEVQAIIEGKKDPDSEFVMMAHKAACCLRKNRYKKGTIVLDLPEIVPVCDANGAVEKLKTEIDNDSHQLVEDLMLLANRCVADFMINKKLPGPFRTHQEPMFDKKKELSRYL
ncbi:RNB domain-containing ribonuclease, partial [Planctomycetota bacterium]